MLLEKLSQTMLHFKIFLDGDEENDDGQDKNKLGFIAHFLLKKLFQMVLIYKTLFFTHSCFVDSSRKINLKMCVFVYLKTFLLLPINSWYFLKTWYHIFITWILYSSYSSQFQYEPSLDTTDIRKSNHFLKDIKAEMRQKISLE